MKSSGWFRSRKRPLRFQDRIGLFRCQILHGFCQFWFSHLFWCDRFSGCLCSAAFYRLCFEKLLVRRIMHQLILQLNVHLLGLVYLIEADFSCEGSACQFVWVLDRIVIFLDIWRYVHHSPFWHARIALASVLDPSFVCPIRIMYALFGSNRMKNIHDFILREISFLLFGIFLWSQVVNERTILFLRIWNLHGRRLPRTCLGLSAATV